MNSESTVKQTETNESTGIEQQWYWDRRNKKAYYPVSIGPKTVRFITAWHVDEVTDAIEGDTIVPLDELGPDYLAGRDAGFDFFDSYRILNDEELAAFEDVE